MASFNGLQTVLTRLVATDLLPIDEKYESEGADIDPLNRVRIPDALVDYHNTLGRIPRLNDAYNHVLSLSGIYLDDGGIVFVEEREERQVR